MIWQLLKRDYMWPAATFTFAGVFALSALAAAYLPLPQRYAARDAFRAAMSAALPFIMLAALWLILNLQSRRTRFEAALPIAGRDLWLSRIFAALPVIWLPPIAGALCGLPPGALFEGASIWTAIALAAYCSRIGQLGLPQWLIREWLRVMLLVPIAVVSLRNYLRQAHWPALPPAGWVMAACALVSVVLFGWGWFAVPAAPRFASSDAEPEPLPARKQASLETGMPWWPVLRSIQGMPLLVMIILVVLSTRSPIFDNAGPLAAIALLAVLSKCRWLLALPISPRRLFGLIAIPWTGLVVVIYEIRLTRVAGGVPQISGWVGLAIELVALFLMLFFAELPGWGRLSKLPVWMRWAPFAAGLVATPVALIYPRTLPIVLAALPQSAWLLGTVLVIPVAASYGLAEKAFCEREYRARYVETVNVSVEVSS